MRNQLLQKLTIAGMSAIDASRAINAFNEAVIVIKPLPKESLVFSRRGTPLYGRKNKSDRKRNRANRWS